MANDWNVKDVGMVRADEQLADLETRLTELYSNASKELTGEFAQFLKQFEDENAEMIDRLERGEINNESYARWYNTHIMQREEYRAKIDSLTNDLTNVDVLATQMINDELPSVYTSSYNFAGFRGEMFAQAGGYTYSSFAIYNVDAVRFITTQNPDLIPWDEANIDIPVDRRWNRRNIQNAIVTGIMHGDTIDQLANRLMPVVHHDEVAAMRTARTSFTYAENRGRRDGTRRVIEAGIPMVEPWMALLDARTRDTHLLLHGTYPNAEGKYGEGIIPSGHLLECPGDPNGDPEQIYNCRCRVNSFLQGVDHTRDDLLYEQMMREEFFDDWIGDQHYEGVNTYKEDEIREALERRRRLMSGELENHEQRVYDRRMERERANGGVGSVPSTPAFRTATTRDEAMDILNDLGFTKISKANVKKIPDELFIANVNRISELNSRFGVFVDDMDFNVKKMRANAKAVVSMGYNQPVQRGLVLGDCYYDSNRFHDTRVRWISEGYFMPCADEYVDVATITHEYGHMVQFSFMYDDEFVEHWNSNLGGDWNEMQRYFRSRDSIPRQQRQEIIAIARENNPDFVLNDNLSTYGATNDEEFFAECFANSQCGKPNELGRAMQIWLERNGF